MQLSDSDLKRLEVEINTSIDKHSLETLTEGPRKHLGMSEIGNDCSRQLWYKFRWMYSETHSGRMLRLFKRGHREEDRYIEILKGIDRHFGVGSSRVLENGLSLGLSTIGLHILNQG